MKDAQKPDHMSLNMLVNELKIGRYMVPDFQREFEWESSDINELMRSIFLDYYIGSLLLWKGKPENFKALSCERLYGYQGAGKPEYIVLDGQQRLTAIYYAFLAPQVALPDKSYRYYYFIRIDKFMNEDYDEAFGYNWVVVNYNAFNNRDESYAAHIFPLKVIGAGGWELPNWFQGYEAFWQSKEAEAKQAGDAEGERRAHKHAVDAKAFGEYVKSITEEYQISYIELDRDLAVDKVCDIFTQINSRGVRLDVFDLINALLKPKGLQLKLMWRNAAPRLSAVPAKKMNVYVLQTMSILRQAYCSPKYLYYLLPEQQKTVKDQDGTQHKEILVPDTADFERGWNEAVDAMEDAIKILRHPQEYGAVKAAFMPYFTILPVFAALRAHVKSLPAARQLDARKKLRHWYWASVFTARYSGAVESISARDFMDLKAWFNDDTSEPSLINEFAQRFRTIDLRKETKIGSSVYNGIFDLLIIQGARDWMTGDVPQHDNLDDHHIIPKSWGKENLKGNIVDSILNRTPLTSDTNRNVIRDRLPNEYLPELIMENGEAHVRAILESHLVSPLAFDILLRNPFGANDFEAFIAERQRTILKAMEDLLIKERLDLPPQYRELDAAVEAIELGVRKTIERKLDGDQSRLPQHLLLKSTERIETVRRKNPGLKNYHADSLSSRLEYLDLRELFDIISSKPLWSLFEPDFLSKETLQVKFNQIADLRNGLRHSRTVSEITQKEGEAAILWFTQVLSS